MTIKPWDDPRNWHLKPIHDPDAPDVEPTPAPAAQTPAPAGERWQRPAPDDPVNVAIRVTADGHRDAYSLSELDARHKFGMTTPPWYEPPPLAYDIAAARRATVPSNLTALPLFASIKKELTPGAALAAPINANSIQSPSENCSQPDVAASSEATVTPACLPTLTVDPYTIAIDTELARIALHTAETELWRLWQLITDDAGSGRIAEGELFTRLQHVMRRNVRRKQANGKLKKTEMTCTPKHFARLLKRGVAGGWWTIGKGYVYRVSSANLSAKLAASHPEAISAHTRNPNLPGTRRVSVNLCGSLPEVEARMYQAWMYERASREWQYKTGKDGQIALDDNGEAIIKRSSTIMLSRQTLKDLFNRSKQTLLRWERRTGIKVQSPNIGMDRDIYAAPDHAYLIAIGDGTEIAAWQLPNTFKIPKMDISRTNGNRGKIRASVRQALATEPPFNPTGEGQSKLLDFGKLRFVDRETSEGIVTGAKALGKHIKKFQDTDTRHYARIATKGDYRQVGLYERSTGDVTILNTQRAWGWEATKQFRKRNMLYKQQIAGRN